MRSWRRQISGKRLLAQMPEIIREKETLAMKLRVHDDIGHSILAARRVLLQHTDLKEIRANAALWERSISVLYRSHQITARSESLEAAKNERKNWALEFCWQETSHNRSICAH